MPLPDDPIECRPHLAQRVIFGAGAVVPAAVGVLAWLDPAPLPFGLRLAGSLGCGAFALLSALFAFYGYVRADTTGLVWRSYLGRTHAAPWTAVTALRTKLLAGEHLHSFIADLADGRSISWEASWTGAEALRDRVRRSLDRTSYRVHGDLDADAPQRFAWPRPRRALVWGTQAMIAALGATFAWLFHGLGYLATHGEIGLAIDMALVIPVPIAFGLFVAARQYWALAQAHCDEELVLDARGLTVTHGPAPFRASWNDVLAIHPRPASGVLGLHIETSAGTVLIPSDHAGRLSQALRERLPSVVLAAWRRAEAARHGDVAIPLGEGVLRHHFRLGYFTPWALEAFALLSINLGLIGELTLRPDDQPLAVPLSRFAAPVALAALVVLLHRGARALIGVTVSPTECDWRGPWRRRRFAWRDVATVTFPAPERSRLTLRLTDGTRLWCLPGLLAGSDELLAGLREHLATAPRGDA
jgi:hypothetical protein